MQFPDDLRSESVVGSVRESALSHVEGARSTFNVGLVFFVVGGPHGWYCTTVLDELPVNTSE